MEIGHEPLRNAGTDSRFHESRRMRRWPTKKGYPKTAVLIDTPLPRKQLLPVWLVYQFSGAVLLYYAFRKCVLRHFIKVSFPQIGYIGHCILVNTGLQRVKYFLVCPRDEFDTVTSQHGFLEWI
jgi:hypothetical protein